MKSETMPAWAVEVPGPIDSKPLRRIEREIPEPGPGQMRIRVRVCGVCRTDLHLAEGDLVPKHRLVIPGHEVVGLVDKLGEGCSRFLVGDRVGVPWLARTCGICRFCKAEKENLCADPRFTGWDLDGGYAPYVVADEAYTYELPAVFSDVEAAPLLCAGIIGYRALRRCVALRGTSRHLRIRWFRPSHSADRHRRGARVHVLTRGSEARALALQLGVSSAGDADDPPPEPLDSAILFAPVGNLVLPALAALDRGGTLAVAGIHLSDIPTLNYQDHLFQERNLCSVTANTRYDGEEFLERAAGIPVRVSTVPYYL